MANSSPAPELLTATCFNIEATSLSNSFDIAMGFLGTFRSFFKMRRYSLFTPVFFIGLASAYSTPILAVGFPHTQIQNPGQIQDPGNSIKHVAQLDGPSFNCADAGTRTEHAICASEDLSQLDLAMSNAYFEKYRRLPPSDQKALLDQQRDWLDERNRCGGDVRCLRRSIAGRLEQLRASADGDTGDQEGAPDGIEASLSGTWRAASAGARNNTGDLTISGGRIEFALGGGALLQKAYPGTDAVFRLGYADNAPPLRCDGEAVQFITFLEDGPQTLLMDVFTTGAAPEEPTVDDPFPSQVCASYFYER